MFKGRFMIQNAALMCSLNKSAGVPGRRERLVVSLVGFAAKGQGLLSEIRIHNSRETERRTVQRETAGGLGSYPPALRALL